MAVTPRTNYQFRDFMEAVRTGTGIASEVVQDVEIGGFLEEAMSAFLLMTGFSYEAPFLTTNIEYTFDTKGHGTPTSADNIPPILRILGPTTALPVKVLFQEDANKGIMVSPRSPTIVAAMNGKKVSFDVVTLPFTTAYSTDVPGLSYLTDLPFSPRILPMLRMYVESRMRGETSDRAYKLLSIAIQQEEPDTTT